jgi:hypothetical protein
MDTNQNSELPSPTDFFIKVPLYKIFTVDEYNWQTIFNIEYFEGTIDTYCVECTKHSTFKEHSTFQEDIEKYRYRNSQSAFDLESAILKRMFVVRFCCTRNTDHEIYFHFLVYNSSIQKIGQYPSIADLSEA